MWVSTMQSTEGLNGTERLIRENRLPERSSTAIFALNTPGSQAFRLELQPMPLAIMLMGLWTIPLVFLASPACWWQIMELSRFCNSSPRRVEDQHPNSASQQEGDKLSFLCFLFYQALNRWWHPPTLGRAIYFTESTNSKESHIEKSSQTCPEVVFNLGISWPRDIDT